MTTLNIGIHRLYEQSDQNVYLHKCTSCNHWNELSYDDYEKGGNILCLNPDGVDVLSKTVVEGSFQFVCSKCGKPLDRWNNGEWVSKYPSRTPNDLTGTKGYFISQMNAVWITGDDLKVKELESRSKQTFYNYVLGKPYQDLKLAVVDEDVYNHTYEDVNPKKDRGEYKFISIGIDWGNIHYITVQGTRANGQLDNIAYYAVEKPNLTDPNAIGSDIDRIRLILDQYNPDIIVADIGDSGDKVAQLIKIYGPDRVFGCKYNSTPRSSGRILPTWTEGSNIVTVDKLTQNKIYIGLLKDGYINHYRNREDSMLQLYVSHLKNVVIRDEEDDKTGEFYQIITRKGDD